MVEIVGQSATEPLNHSTMVVKPNPEQPPWWCRLPWSMSASWSASLMAIVKSITPCYVGYVAIARISHWLSTMRCSIHGHGAREFWSRSGNETTRHGDLHEPVATYLTTLVCAPAGCRWDAGQWVSVSQYQGRLVLYFYIIHWFYYKFVFVFILLIAFSLLVITWVRSGTTPCRSRLHRRQSIFQVGSAFGTACRRPVSWRSCIGTCGMYLVRWRDMTMSESRSAHQWLLWVTDVLFVCRYCTRPAVV